MLGKTVMMHALQANGADPFSLLANPVVWAVVGFAVGVYGFIHGFLLLRRKRFIQDIPRCTIRGAPLGVVEVSGKAVGPYTIVGPMSEEDCFYYRAVAWCKPERSGWQRAAEESLAAPFFLDDSTGKMMVDPRGAETDLPPIFCEEYASNVPERLLNFLSRHAVPSGLPIKLEEYCVRPGDTLFAMGTLKENNPPPEFLSPEAADLQRRGEIEALLQPGAVVVQGTRERTAKISSDFDLHPPVILTASGADRPLFISASSQSEIVQTLAVRSAFCIWAGPILSLLCFWYLLNRLGYQ